MALTYGFYNSVSSDREYDAIDMSRLFDGIILDGVYAAIGDYFIVTENGTPDMNVIVGTGRAWFDHTWSYNDADVVLPVTTADALLPRIDVVYLEVNEDSGVRANKLDILDGTPASTPVAPTLTKTTTVHQYPLAHIYVGAAVTTITNANLTNKVGTAECPFVTCPLTYVTTNDLLAQWESEWEQWFQDIIDQLSTEAETNLQNQIWDLAGVVSGAPPYATDMVSLNSHDHDGAPGNQIPTAGLVNLAVNESKLGNLSVSTAKIIDLNVTEPKLGNSSVTPSKIATTVAGNGLSGGAGSALAVRVDDSTIQIYNDILRVKDLGITTGKIAYSSIGAAQLTNRTRRWWISPDKLIGVTPSYSANYGPYIEFPDGVETKVYFNHYEPDDYDSGTFGITVVWSAAVTGTCRFDFDYKWVEPGENMNLAMTAEIAGFGTETGANILIWNALSTFPGPSGSDIFLKGALYRPATGDTIAGTVRLYGIILAYEADS